MARHLSEKIPFVFAALKSLGISLNPSSRLPRLAQVFLAEDGSYNKYVPKLEPVDFELALESLREFHLFEYILDPWKFGTEEEPLKKLQIAALKDQALQYMQRKGETRGRDTQVELFIATAFRRSGAGADIVSPRDGTKCPDIRTRACNRHFFIEAKRVKSRGAVVGAIEDAVEQVQATGCPGAAYLDVTMAFNQENRPANEHLRENQVQPAFRSWLQDQFEPIRVEVDSTIARSRLTSIFFQHHLLIPVDGTVRLESMILTYPPRAGGRYEREDKEIRRTLRQNMPR